MVSFEIDGLRFHLRAAAVVIEGEWVLLHRLEGDDIWALPGGRVNPGEEAAAAVVREMLEETDEKVSVAELLFAVENFFGVERELTHEVGLYFRTSLSPTSRLRDTSRSHAGIEGAHKLEFRWFHRFELEQADLRPAFLKQALQERELRFRHVVQRGENAL
jgi:ADP-ribose pyrophosphatase YjhB (NUDIX family)